MTTGEILKKLIENKGITPYELSKTTGISESTISRILNKNSKPNIKNSKILAKYFGIEKQYLINGKGSEPTSIKFNKTHSIKELSIFVVDNFDEFLQITSFSNAIELEVKNRLLKIMEVKMNELKTKINKDS